MRIKRIKKIKKIKKLKIRKIRQVKKIRTIPARRALKALRPAKKIRPAAKRRNPCGNHGAGISYCKKHKVIIKSVCYMTDGTSGITTWSITAESRPSGRTHPDCRFFYAGVRGGKRHLTVK